MIASANKRVQLTLTSQVMVNGLAMLTPEAYRLLPHAHPPSPTPK